MDVDELEKRIEKDLEELSDDGDDDDDIDLHEFSQRLKASLVDRKTSNASDLGEAWHELIKYEAVADGFIEEIQHVHNSEVAQPDVVNFEVPNLSDQGLSSGISSMGDESLPPHGFGAVVLDAEKDREIIETVRDLMSTMLNAVECVAPIYAGHREEARPVVIDISSLPKLIDDNDLESARTATSYVDTTVAFEAAAAISSVRVLEDELEANRKAEEAHKEFEEQMNALRLESERAEQAAADAKRRAAERKARAEELLQEARRERRAVEIQSLWRCVIQKRRYSSLLPLYRQEQEEKRRRAAAAEAEKARREEVRRESLEQSIMASEEQLSLSLRRKEKEEQKRREYEERQRREKEQREKEQREREIEILRSRVEQRRVHRAAVKVAKCVQFVRLLLRERRAKKAAEEAAAAEAARVKEAEERAKADAEAAGRLAASATASASSASASSHLSSADNGSNHVSSAAGGGSTVSGMRGKVKTGGLKNVPGNVPGGSAAVVGWGGRVGPARSNGASNVVGSNGAMADTNIGNGADNGNGSDGGGDGGGDGEAGEFAVDGEARDTVSMKSSDGNSRNVRDFDLFEADSSDDENNAIGDDGEGSAGRDADYYAEMKAERFKQKILAASGSQQNYDPLEWRKDARFEYTEAGIIRHRQTFSVTETPAAASSSTSSSTSSSSVLVSQGKDASSLREEDSRRLSKLADTAILNSSKEPRFAQGSLHRASEMLQLKSSEMSSLPAATTASIGGNGIGASGSNLGAAESEEAFSLPLLQALRDWRAWFLPICDELSAKSKRSMATAAAVAGGGSGTMSTNSLHCNQGMGRSASSCAVTAASASSSSSSSSSSGGIPAEDKAELSNFGLLTSTPENVTEVTLNVESLTSCKFLRSLSQLKQLQVNVNKLKNLEGLQGMCKLEELSAKDNIITDLSAIKDLPSLKTLRLDTNQLSAAGLETVSGLSNLLTLTASSNKLSYLPCLKHCHQLQRLEVYHNSIMDVSMEALSALHCLTHLDLGRNKLQQISGEALSHCPLLQTLVLSQNQLTEAPSPLYLPCLKVLWLSGNRLQNLRNWALPAGSSNNVKPTKWPVFLPMLEKLHLQDNSITALNDGVFATSPLLSEVDASFNNLTALADLEGLRGVGLLRRLQLHDNPIFAASELREGATLQSATVHLKPWLAQTCPLLNNVSGSSLQSSRQLPAGFASISNADLRSNAASNATTEGATSSGTSVSSREHMISMYGYSSSHMNHMWGLSLDEAVEEEQLRAFRRACVAPHSLNSRGDISDISDDSEGALRQRRLMQLLVGFSGDINSLRMREKIEKRSSAESTSGKSSGSNPVVNQVSNDSQGNPEDAYWDLASVHQSQRHLNRLLCWMSDQKGHALYEPVQLEDDLTSRDDDSLMIVRYQTRSAMRNSVEKVKQHLLSPPAGGKAGASALAIIQGNPRLLSGILRLQAWLRGWRVRRHIKGLLSSAKYHDDELDDLLGMEGGDEFEFNDYDEYLRPMSLRNDWAGAGGVSAGTQDGYDGNRHIMHKSHSAELSPGKSEDESGVLSTSVTSLVYGDHKRRRSIQQSEHTSTSAFEHSTGTAHPAVPGLMPSSAPTANSMASPRASISEYDRDHGTPSSILSRPASSMTEDSGIAHSDAGSRQLSARSGHSRQQEHIANEWGISDPRVLAAISKRNKKMKSLQHAKEAREREKDPEVRYQRFLKNSFGPSAAGSAGGGSTALRQSGNGGRGVQGRGGAGAGRGRGGVKARKAIPAWMLGQQDEDDNDDDG